MPATEKTIQSIDSPSPAPRIPEIVEIPVGEYLMGQDDGRDEERPVHEVCVRAFGLARFQITNEQYDAFCRSSGRHPAKFRNNDELNQPLQPVTGPSWFAAAAYCEWLSQTTGKRFRLPGEAEWEWAARGGLAGQLHPWGNEAVTERENYHTRWQTGPEPVGTSLPNGFGLYDMCENVHEWCAEWYDPKYYEVSPRNNPRGATAGTRRASRGGAWRHQIKISRCAARSSIPPELEYADYGFRVACELG